MKSTVHRKVPFYIIETPFSVTATYVSVTDRAFVLDDEDKRAAAVAVVSSGAAAVIAAVQRDKGAAGGGGANQKKSRNGKTEATKRRRHTCPPYLSTILVHNRGLIQAEIKI
jgi:hypothetical protein